MGGDDLFHGAGRQPVPGDVDHVVDPAHDIEVAVGVTEATVAGDVVAREGREIGPDETIVVVPQRRQAPGGQRQLDGHRALGAVRHLLARTRVEDLHAVTGHRLRRRTRLHRQVLDAEAVRHDGPSRLGLPPVVDDGPLQEVGSPVVRVRIEALTSEEEVREP
jgi:hypothetical protein